MRLSFIVLTYRRPEMLRRCLESLGRPRGDDWEICVVFNGPDPQAQTEIARSCPWTRVLSIERSCRGEARNKAVAKSSGSVVFFLDDDTRAPEGFAERVLDKFQRYPEAPCIGGPNLRPPESGPLERAIDFLLRSPLGAGPMRVRWRPGGGDRFVPSWSLTLCNLGVRREVFERHGLAFPKDCASAEENLLLHRIEDKLGRVLLSDELAVLHERRSAWGSFCRQVFQSGRGRVQIARLDAGTLSPVVFAPLLVPLAIAGACAFAITPWAAAPLSLYVAASLAETARMAIVERDPAGAARLPWLLGLGHLAYAGGLISGVLWR